MILIWDKDARASLLRPYFESIALVGNVFTSIPEKLLVSTQKIISTVQIDKE